MVVLPNLDCDVTSVCNLSCLHCNRMVNPYRHSGKPVPVTTPEQVESDLRHFGRVARTRRWAAVGGEPLLHKQLLDILQVVRASHVADNIALWTNGILVPKMSDALWRAFDTLVVSAYPGKLTDEVVTYIKDRCASEGRELVFKDERTSPNWTRILEPAPTDDAYTQTKYDLCWYRTYCFALNFGHLFRCCTSPHIPQLLQGRGFGADGLCITDITEEEMLAFINRKEFMESCRLCAGRNTPSSVSVPWGETRDPQAWIEVSSGRAK